MATEQDIELLLRESEETLEALQRFALQAIPGNLSEAAEKGIDLALQAGEAAILIRYPNEERAKDRQRCIRLDHALDLLSEFEEEYIASTASGFVRKVFAAFPIIGEGLVIWNAALGIWAAIQTLEVEAVRKAIAHLWLTVLRHILSITAAAEVAGPLKDILAMRRKYDVRLRKKALPQRTVRRVWRRKRTRG